MGRIKTRDIKRLARKLIVENKEFKGEFGHNKNMLKDMHIDKSKRMSNKIAGYIAKTLRRTHI